MNTNSWQTTAQNKLYENSWLSFYEDKTIRPDGEPGVYGVVRVKKHGVRIIAINNEGKLLLNREFRYGISRTGYEFPAGGIDANFTPLQTAQRELLQETGLEADNWRELAESVPWPSVVDLKIKYFLATGIKGEIHHDNNEGNESIQESKWFSLEEIKTMALSGEIFCGETLSGLYLYTIIN